MKTLGRLARTLLLMIAQLGIVCLLLSIVASVLWVLFNYAQFVVVGWLAIVGCVGLFVWFASAWESTESAD